MRVARRGANGPLCVRLPACSGRVYFGHVCSQAMLPEVALLRSHGLAAREACECWAFEKQSTGSQTWLSLSPLGQAALRRQLQPPPERQLQPAAATAAAGFTAAQAQSPKAATAVCQYHEAVVQRLLGKPRCVSSRRAAVDGWRLGARASGILARVHLAVGSASP